MFTFEKKNTKTESSFGKALAIKTLSKTALQQHLRMTVTGDERFRGRVLDFADVLYKTIDAIAPYDLNHHGPLTAEMVNRYCSKKGLELLKFKVKLSKEKYRKDIYTGLDEILGMSDIYIEALSAVVKESVNIYCRMA
jgi:hypothetical protein